MERIKVTAKGQLTLPKLLREKLNIKKGDYLEAYVRGKELVLKPMPKAPAREILLEYCHKNSAQRLSLDEARRILSRVPFSFSDQVRKLREEE